jgi:hypothetical protein
LHRIYPHLFPVFPRFSSSQQLMVLVLTSFIHRVSCFSWSGVWFWFVRFRSTHLLPQFQDMLLCNGLSSVSGVRRWSPSSPPPPGCRRMSHTPESFSTPRARGARACSLHHLSLHPLVVLDETGAAYCREAFLGRRVFLTRLSCRILTLTHPFLYCCCCILFSVFLFSIFMGLCVVSFSPCFSLLLWCLGPCDSIHVSNYL